MHSIKPRILAKKITVIDNSSNLIETLTPPNRPHDRSHVIDPSNELGPYKDIISDQQPIIISIMILLYDSKFCFANLSAV